MHVYLHVPFCARRCSYCDFAIAVRREVPSEAYVEAVLQEWALWQVEPVWDENPAIQTIYLGGGTPSRLTGEAVARLLGGITSHRTFAPGAEITLEANPDDVTLSLAKAWQAGGINRVSLGVQSFDPGVLRWMHRVHTAGDVPRAVDALRCAGIQDLSLDLIFGLPAKLGRDWEKDLSQAFALHPEHVSLYGLTVEPHTVFSHQAGRGELTPVDDEQYAAEFLAAHQMLLSHGYEHYEVSNAALPGHRSRHNSAYWRRATFIGLGPSAHSGYASERRWNLREWAAYERAIMTGASPVAGRERLDLDAIRLEEIYLGLRTSDGLPAAVLRPETRHQWENSGWASFVEDRLQLSPEGWLRLDALVPAITS